MNLQIFVSSSVMNLNEIKWNNVSWIPSLSLIVWLEMLENDPSIYSKSMLEHLLKNAWAFVKEHLLCNITDQKWVRFTKKRID